MFFANLIHGPEQNMLTKAESKAENPDAVNRGVNIATLKSRWGTSPIIIIGCVVDIFGMCVHAACNYSIMQR